MYRNRGCVDSKGRSAVSKGGVRCISALTDIGIEFLGVVNLFWGWGTPTAMMARESNSIPTALYAYKQRKINGRRNRYLSNMRPIFFPFPSSPSMAPQSKTPRCHTESSPSCSPPVKAEWRRSSPCGRSGENKKCLFTNAIHQNPTHMA